MSCPPSDDIKSRERLHGGGQGGRAKTVAANQESVSPGAIGYVHYQWFRPTPTTLPKKRHQRHFEKHQDGCSGFPGLSCDDGEKSREDSRYGKVI